MIKLTIILATVLSIGFMSPVGAEAETPNLFWKVKMFLQDIKEMITLDPEKRAELKIEHAKDRQIVIETMTKQNKPIPPEFTTSVNLKVAEADDLVKRNNLGAFDDTLSILKSVGEVNKIRQLYSQFPAMQDATESEKDQFNAEINSLESVKRYCIGEIDVRDYKSDYNSFSKLTEKCPVLNSRTAGELQLIVDSNDV